MTLPGRYFDNVQGSHELRLVLDAAPLLELIEEVERLESVYEFMTLQRTGELMHYVRAVLLPGDDFLRAELNKVLGYRAGCEEAPSATLAEMQECFPLAGDMPAPLAEAWESTGYRRLCREWLPEVMGQVRDLQRRVRAGTDVLLQAELALMADGAHPCDWLPAVPRVARARPRWRWRSQVPAVPLAVTRAVLALVRGLGLPAVAAGWPDVDLWRGLCALQMERAVAAGCAPAEALALFSADGGFPVPLHPENWGGDVHLSYEGLRWGTLVVRPGWREFDPGFADAAGSLAAGLGGGDDEAPFVRFPGGLECSIHRCLVLVTPNDFGEIGCARRWVVEGWSIYVEKALGVNPAQVQRLLSDAAPSGYGDAASGAG